MLYRTPVLEPGTLVVSRPWAQWFAALMLRAGGPNAPTNLELAAQLAALGSLTPALAALTTRVAALEAVVFAHQGTPSVQAASAGAGSGAFASVTGRDARGTLTLQTQSFQPRRSHSEVLRLTFAAAYTTAPRVLLAAANGSAWALPRGTLQLHTADVSTTGFTLRSGVTRFPRQGDVYLWSYVVTS